MVTYNGDLRSSISTNNGPDYTVCNTARPEECNETIKNMLDELRALSMDNYESISRIRTLFSGTPALEQEDFDRSSISHDIRGDLIIQQMIAEVLHDIFNGLGV